MHTIARLVTVVAIVGCPIASQAQSTALHIISDPGEYIGQGLTYFRTPADGAFTALQNYFGGITIRYQGPATGDHWILDFTMPGGAALTRGTHVNVLLDQLWSIEPSGVAVSGQHRGCSSHPVGRFTVLDVEYGPGPRGPNTAIARFSADFEQQCHANSQILRGSIRFQFPDPPFIALPGVLDVEAAPGRHGITIVARLPGSQWSAFSDVPWITLQATATDATAFADVARNPGTASRTGLVTIGGSTVVVTQRANGTPSEPLDLVATSNHHTVHLAWTPGVVHGDATSFRIEAGVSPGGTAVVVDTSDSTPTLAIPGAPAGTFYLRVRGRNEFGIGPPSDEIVLRIASSGTSLATAPRHLIANLSGTSGRALALSWQPPSSAPAFVSYRIEVGSRTGARDLAVIPAGSATMFSHSAVPAGAFFLRVRAVTPDGESPPSNEVLIVPGFDFAKAPPGVPRWLPPRISGSDVRLSWGWGMFAGTAERHRVEVGTTPEGPTVSFDTTRATFGVAFQQVPRGRYYVRVRDVNAMGVGPAAGPLRIDVP